MDKYSSREAFLLDALDYYTVDPDARRCKNEASNTCVYSPFTIGKISSEGCLIGRNLEPQLAKRIDEEQGECGVQDAIVRYRDLIPKELIALDSRGAGSLFTFLERCQSLHDSSPNWCPTGLSPEGRNYLHSIVSQFDLDKSQFSKYLETSA